MRNKVIAIYQSGKGYRAHLRLWDSSEPLSTNGENLRAVVNLLVSGLPKNSNISVHYSTIRQGSGKKIHGSVPSRNCSKRTQSLISYLTKTILKIQKTYGKNFLGTEKTQVKFFGRFCPVTGGIKLAQHFIKRTL